MERMFWRAVGTFVVLCGLVAMLTALSAILMGTWWMLAGIFLMAVGALFVGFGIEAVINPLGERGDRDHSRE